MTYCAHLTYGEGPKVPRKKPAVFANQGETAAHIKSVGKKVHGELLAVKAGRVRRESEGEKTCIKVLAVASFAA